MLNLSLRLIAGVGLMWAVIGPPASRAAAPFPDAEAFTDRYCSTCHNDVDREGGLDLTTLEYDPANPANFQTWVRIHDRLQAGEMPPKEKRRPDAARLGDFVGNLAASLAASEGQKLAGKGRATQRRLNRYEYENALRDILALPLLQVKGQFPEDGEAHRFNKIGDVLDVSYVQMARYMSAADTAIRQVLALQLDRPEPAKQRHYAREHRNFLRFRPGINDNASPDRDSFPVLDAAPQPEVRALREPATVGDADPAMRDREAVGWVHGYYQTAFNSRWGNFTAPAAGRYKVRWRGYTIWVGPGGYWRLNTFRNGVGVVKIDQPTRWYVPNFDDVTPGRRSEVITVYARGATTGRRVGAFDLTPEPATHELEVFLLPNESLVTDASRFFRSVPTSTIGYFTNPLAQHDGLPGVAFQWLEVEGPFQDDSLSAGYKTLFGDLPLRRAGVADGGTVVRTERAARGGGGGRQAEGEGTPVGVEIVSTQPKKDAERLIRSLVARAYRQPAAEEDIRLFVGVFNSQFDAGVPFTDALIAAQTAVFASPGFVFFQEQPGRLDDHAIASRLSFFLWNSEPDEALRARAARGELRAPGVLQAETERLLTDPRSARFVGAFLDYWLDLRKMEDNSPSTTLYNDYYLDDWLAESALDESRMFFADLVARDLPARNIVSSDYTFLNERLAAHYGVPGIQGAAMRRVQLPPDSVRGGFLTQASVLKVTANGTTTSPVLRGVWITERILGRVMQPPPPAIGAVEPDIRGAVTIREQLARHRADPSCAACHSKMDPPGFALESFDVMGGWRERYRGVSEDHAPEIGVGKNGHAYVFHYAQPVDPGGELPDGRTFRDVRDFKQLLLADERLIARNLARQLAVYATGAPVRFTDRDRIEKILHSAAPKQYGVRSILHALVQSDLFLNK